MHEPPSSPKAGALALLARIVKRHPLAWLALALVTCLSLLTDPLDGMPPAASPWHRLADAVGLPLTGAQRFLFDSYQKALPREAKSQPVTIVAIDEASLDATGQWPWPRNRMAALIERINSHGPAAIGLDIFMPEPDETSPNRFASRIAKDDPALAQRLRALPDHDALLASALHQSPSVLGAAGFDFDAPTTSQHLRVAPMLTQGDPAQYVRAFPHVLASLPQLQAAARGQALLSVDTKDSVIRRIPLVATVNQVLVPGLAMEMFRVASGSPSLTVRAGPRGVESVGVADLSVPTQPPGDVWLHFAPFEAGMHRYLSAVDVLEGKAAPDLLAGKVVLIGLTGSGLTDVRTTARGEITPGIEIQAQLVEALFDGAYLLRPTWTRWLELALLVATGLLLLVGVSQPDSRLSLFLRNRPQQASWLTLAGVAALLAAGFATFHWGGILLDTATPAIGVVLLVGLLLGGSLTAGLRQARARLARLVDNGIRMGQQHDRHRMLQIVQEGAREIAPCQSVTVYLKTPQQTLVLAPISANDEASGEAIALVDASGQAQLRLAPALAANTGQTVVVDNARTDLRLDPSAPLAVHPAAGVETLTSVTLPLKPREGQVVGVMHLVNALDPLTGKVVPFDRKMLSLLEALAAQAAVAIENRDLLEAQQALVDSMIQIIAGAIDTKSPYTGAHCKRVPELAFMLAEKACEVRDGPLADFELRTDDEWREFRIGAWLHDCGKVSTPEYVVDKATKLETIFNRIHEVRMRFEVLLRDAMVDRLLAIHERGENRAVADATFEERKARLIDDFAFVAECNLGGEFMAPERIERLQQIAGIHWMRHFDDRLGLSHEELRRHEREPAPPLPAREALLADKVHHIFERPPTQALDPRYGFKLKVPEHLYNRGEVYNLSIGRGTLTAEERFKINEHIIQTIVMLENIPLPPNLKRVPEYAGTHHETLIGSGYPRGLVADDLSVPARIMAIADIFEALTASDRPYKKPATLSQCVKILSQFKKDQHIDPVLFDLFLTSGVYKDYAAKYLRPEQVDDVDIANYLG